MRARLLLTVIALGLAPASAHAAVAQVGTSLWESAYYAAGPGEANRLEVTFAGGTVHFRDSGATITAGLGCAAVSAHEVTCTPAPAFGGPSITVLLGDRDDVGTVKDAADGRVMLHGDAGDDALSVTGSPQIFQLEGDAGDDRLRGADSPRRLPDPVINPAGLDNFLAGGDGDDVLTGGRADEELYGGDGADRLDGGAGRDVVRGEAGDDVVAGGTGGDWVDGGPGRDELHGGPGHDRLRGGAGADRLFGEAGNDDLDGDHEPGDFGDFPTDVPSPDLLDGGPGDDMVLWSGHVRPVHADLEHPGDAGEAGEHDRLVGIESLTGGQGADVLRGDDGPNRLRGARYEDLVETEVLDGRGGDDRIIDVSNPDGAPSRISGGPGDDFIVARSKNLAACGPGVDTVRPDRILTPDVRSFTDLRAPLLTDCERVDFGRALGFLLRLRASGGSIGGTGTAGIRGPRAWGDGFVVLRTPSEDGEGRLLGRASWRWPDSAGPLAPARVHGTLTAAGRLATRRDREVLVKAARGTAPNGQTTRSVYWRIRL